MDFWPQSALSGRLLIIQFNRTVLKHFDLGPLYIGKVTTQRAFVYVGYIYQYLTILENNKVVKYLLIYLIVKNPQYGNTDDIFI